MPSETPRTARRLRRGALAGLLALPIAATPALAQTVAATGTGQATVKVPGKLTQEKIAKAVGVARTLAIPRAVTNATVQAGLYAAAGGLTLGPVQSIGEPPPSPYGYFGYSIGYSTGRFGPNQYCGVVTTVKRRRINGRSRVVARHRHFTCSKPESVVVSLYVTFAATPAPAP